jgi:hypothetical protein
MRWFELTIWRTERGQYVAEGVGRSEFDGEEDKVWAEIASTASELIAALHRTGDGGEYLPRTTQYALEDAARVDSDMAAAYVVRI